MILFYILSFFYYLYFYETNKIYKQLDETFQTTILLTATWLTEQYCFDNS